MPCSVAHCTAQHAADEPCDECPYDLAGAPGRLLLDLFYMAVTSHEDPNAKGTISYALDLDRMMHAFSLYEITERVRAKDLLVQAVAIMNNQAGPPPVDDPSADTIDWNDDD